MNMKLFLGMWWANWFDIGGGGGALIPNVTGGGLSPMISEVTGEIALFNEISWYTIGDGVHTSICKGFGGMALTCIDGVGGTHF